LYYPTKVKSALTDFDGPECRHKGRRFDDSLRSLVEAADDLGGISELRKNGRAAIEADPRRGEA
jgi:hypothetical protein